MAKKLVSYYDLNYAKDIASKLKYANNQFDSKVFLEYLNTNLGNETFLARQDLYVNAFELALHIEYKDFLEVIISIWGSELREETGMFKEGWWLWPLGRYVEKHALEDIKATMVFVRDFTKRHTGEYIVRPILMNHTRYIMEIFLEWSHNNNVHVRRLSSEGMRISLPWAVKTLSVLNEKILYEQILTSLIDDSSRFVQKSVGNNINDLYKIDSEFADKIIRNWEKLSATKNIAWIINHARRNQNDT